jgi:hypothetical protein
MQVISVTNYAKPTLHGSPIPPRYRVSLETSFYSKQPKLETKPVSALSETKNPKNVCFECFASISKTPSCGVSISPCDWHSSGLSHSFFHLLAVNCIVFSLCTTFLCRKGGIGRGDKWAALPAGRDFCSLTTKKLSTEIKQWWDIYSQISGDLSWNIQFQRGCCEVEHWAGVRRISVGCCVAQYTRRSSVGCGVAQ